MEMFRDELPRGWTRSSNEDKESLDSWSPRGVGKIITTPSPGTEEWGPTEKDRGGAGVAGRKDLVEGVN